MPAGRSPIYTCRPTEQPNIVSNPITAVTTATGPRRVNKLRSNQTEGFFVQVSATGVHDTRRCLRVEADIACHEGIEIELVTTIGIGAAALL